MKRFCRENPVERIGYQKDGVADIKKHRWFQVQILIFNSFNEADILIFTLSLGYFWHWRPVSGEITIYFV